MRSIIEQRVHSHGPAGQPFKSFILQGSINWDQPRLGVKGSFDCRTAGVMVLTRLSEAPFMSESSSLTSTAACYSAVCEAWSAHTDLKIALPYLTRRSPLFPCVSQWSYSGLLTVIFNEFKKLKAYIIKQSMNIKFIYCLINYRTTELDCYSWAARNR
jgi:hypothetical protein